MSPLGEIFPDPKSDLGCPLSGTTLTPGSTDSSRLIRHLTLPGPLPAFIITKSLHLNLYSGQYLSSKYLRSLPLGTVPTTETGIQYIIH